MSKTNCINCGAAKDIEEIRCPFCGTTYLDLTAIDFASGDPVVCQFVLPHIRIANEKYSDIESKNRVVMSMLAIPQLDEITQTANTVSIFGGNHSYPLSSFVDSYDINVGVSFRPVTRPDHNTLFELEVEK